jgi:hypothetical protein
MGEEGGGKDGGREKGLLPSICAGYRQEERKIYWVDNQER